MFLLGKRNRSKFTCRQVSVGVGRDPENVVFDGTLNAMLIPFTAVDVLNDLLNYDKIEQGNLKLQLKLLSGWHLAEKVIPEFRLAAASKNIRIGLSFDMTTYNLVPEEKSHPILHSNDLPDHVKNLCLLGYSVRLTQVLRNLMSNR